MIYASVRFSTQKENSLRVLFYFIGFYAILFISNHIRKYVRFSSMSDFGHSLFNIDSGSIYLQSLSNDIADINNDHFSFLITNPCQSTVISMIFVIAFVHPSLLRLTFSFSVFSPVRKARSYTSRWYAGYSRSVPPVICSSYSFPKLPL